MLTVCAHTTDGFGLVDAAGAYHGILKLSPALPNLLCPLLLNESRNFTRYRFKRLRFIYHAIGSTASGVRLNFAFVNDPHQSEFTAITGSSSYNLLSTTPNSVPFSPWSGWAMDCKISTDLCYIAPGLSYLSYVTADVRQAYAGMIACLADSDPGATFTYGQLWWDFDVELVDVCPTSSLPSTSALMSSATASEIKENPSQSVGVKLGTAQVNPNIGPTITVSSTDSLSGSSSSKSAAVRADADYIRVEDPSTTSPVGTRVLQSARRL
jgi:hypothetical protein